MDNQQNYCKHYFWSDAIPKVWEITISQHIVFDSLVTGARLVAKRFKNANFGLPRDMALS